MHSLNAQIYVYLSVANVIYIYCLSVIIFVKKRGRHKLRLKEIGYLTNYNVLCVVTVL